MARVVDPRISPSALVQDGSIIRRPLFCSQYRRRTISRVSARVFYGIASHQTGKVFDWYPTQADAERALSEILDDEPAFEPVLYIALVDLSSATMPEPSSTR